MIINEIIITSPVPLNIILVTREIVFNLKGEYNYESFFKKDRFIQFI